MSDGGRISFQEAYDQHVATALKQHGQIKDLQKMVLLLQDDIRELQGNKVNTSKEFFDDGS